MAEMNPLDWIAYILMAAGALNWLGIGIFDFNTVHELFTIWGGVFAERVTYSVVGASGIYSLARIPQII